jgi:hypothetical protein
MADQNDEKAKAAEQASLFAELEKSDVKVADDKAAAMKENILKASSGGAWLGLGVHEVLIQSIELAQAKTGTLGMKFTVENEDGKGEVTFWLSEAALPYTIENVSRLVVHNTEEAKKAEARTFMSNVTSAKELFEVAQAKLIDGQAWLSVRESKTQTYTDQKTGEIKPSLDRNLLAYKPKETAEQTVAKEVGGSTVVDEKTKLDIPF